MKEQDFLHKIKLFKGMSNEDLALIAKSVIEVPIKAKEILFEEGDIGNRAFFIQDGEVEIIKGSSGREVLLAVRGPGAVIGEIALLESIPRTATVRARSDAILYSLEKEELDQLLKTSPSAMESLFQTILGRLREDQMQLQQSEKMAQLGSLTAGVAHELNNPAAAVKRSADHLIDAIKTLDASYAHIGRLGFNDEQWKILAELGEVAYQSAKKTTRVRCTHSQ